MSCPNLVRALTVAALVQHGAARAEPAAPGGAAPARSPVSIRLRVSPDALRARFIPSGGPVSPPTPSGTVDVGEQARDAYAAVLRRIAREPAAVAAELEISTVSADVDFDADGWHAVVVHGLVLRGPNGDELGRWAVKGREAIVGVGDDAIPGAFARAAHVAAVRFDSSFEEPPGVARWLAANGIEAGARPRPVEPSRAQPPSLIRRAEGPPRERWISYLDVGGGLASFEGSTDKTDRQYDDMPFAIAARAGVSMPWAFAQLHLSRWGTPQAFPLAPDSALTVTTFGVDAGPVVRLGSVVEVAAGAGWAFTHARALLHPLGNNLPMQVFTTSRQMPSLFGAVRYVTWIGSRRIRTRLAAEVRTTFRSTLDWAETGVVTWSGANWNYNDRERIVSGTQFLATIGFELPLSR